MGRYIFDAEHERPEDRRRRVAEAMARQQVPTDIGSGLNAIGNAISMRAQANERAFPDAPGGKPDFLNRLGAIFGMRRGGLY